MKSTSIVYRSRGFYEIKFRVNLKWIGSSYATNRRMANKISKLFINSPALDGQYTQVGRELVKI